MADVRLVDLDVFKRYSLAIRQESAPVEEVLAVLEATRRQVEAADARASGPESFEPPPPEPGEARPARRRARRASAGTDGDAGAAVSSGR